MTYFITVEMRTKKALGTDQQDKLREAVLHAIDCTAQCASR